MRWPLLLALPLGASLAGLACSSLLGIEDFTDQSTSFGGGASSSTSSSGAATSSSSTGSGASDGGPDADASMPEGHCATTWWFAGTTSVRAAGVVAATSNRVAIAGEFQQTLTWGGTVGSISAHEDIDGYIAMLSAQGEVTWAHRIGRYGDQRVYGLAGNASSELAVVGTTYGDLFVDDDGVASNSTEPAVTDLYLLAFDSGGDLRWPKQLGNGDWSNAARGVAFDEHGVVVTGEFSNGFDFGNGWRAAMWADAFVASFGGDDGDALWDTQIGEAGNDVGRAVAAAGPDGVIVAGGFWDRLGLDDGDGGVIAVGGEDVFVAKLPSPSGPQVVPTWHREWGSPYDDAPAAVAVGPTGIAVVGRFADTIDFGGSGGEHTSSGNADAFVVMLSADGETLWSHAFGGELDDIAEGVVIDGDGTVFVTGSLHGVVLLPGEENASATVGTDAFVAAYSSGGAPLWSLRFGGAGDQRSAGIGLGGNGQLVIHGDSTSTPEWDCDATTGAPSGVDLFVTQIAF